MRKSFLLGMFILITSMPAAYGQNDESSRNRTKEQLGNLLEKAAADINVTFRPSTKQPFNYVGMLTQGLSNADSFEIVISVTPNNTIGFRIYPHYKNGYVNVDRVSDRPGCFGGGPLPG